MKRLEFTAQGTKEIYDAYINRCILQLQRLRPEDREDCLMEINSYVYEYMQSHAETDEAGKLKKVLERLGDPSVTLREIVAAKKVEEASQTFRPRAVMEAIFMNLQHGFVYIITFILGLLLLSVPVLIAYKLILPDEAGLWVGGNTFVLGTVDAPESSNGPVREVLGNAFIPVVIILGAMVYAVIILLLRAVRKNHPGRKAISQIG